MASRNRQESGKENLRQEIMDAARELFVAEGYASVSMRKIADKIGYSPTTIYLYFKDKSDLLHQICEQTFAHLAQNIKSIQQLSDNPLEKLRSGLREYVYFGLKHPSQYEIVFITPLPHKFESDFDETNGRVAFDTMRDVVAECVSDNLLKTNDVELISQTLWAGIHGVTSDLIQHGHFPFVERDKLIDNVIDTLIIGTKA
ncbi:MAG TPA: TetR/AcrR family transcriptional regulator [Pyrinomonadaceae bacterium]|nr:TetR/AcrR family transcriptional regulator [Pyrinomonadaceae bacterium]